MSVSGGNNNIPTPTTSEKRKFVPIIEGFPSFPSPHNNDPREGIASKKQRTLSGNQSNELQLSLSSMPLPPSTTAGVNQTQYNNQYHDSKQHNHNEFDDDFENLLNDIALMITPRVDGHSHSHTGMSPRLEMLSPRLAAALAATTSSAGGIQSIIKAKATASSMKRLETPSLHKSRNGMSKGDTQLPPNTARSQYSLNLSLFDGDIADWLQEEDENHRENTKSSSSSSNSSQIGTI